MQHSKPEHKCECEHKDHFSSTPQTDPSQHDYGKAEAKTIVKTPNGVFHVCMPCLWAHWGGEEDHSERVFS